MSSPVWMARRARSWPMISLQARASVLDPTGTRSGQQFQRSWSGESSRNPLFVRMGPLLSNKLSYSSPFLKAAGRLRGRRGFLMKIRRTSARIRPLRIPGTPFATEGRTIMKIHQGKLQAKGLRIAIVVSRFNSFISERLLEGALEALQKMGAQETDLTVYKVPGSFEVPLVAKKIAKAKAADGILCIGALIRGDTPHF